MDFYDILPCPGDIWPDREIYMKHRGGDSYLYYISWEWVTIFLTEIHHFLYNYEYQLGGIFLDEWGISHTWWEIPDEVREATQVDVVTQRKMMEVIETTLLEFTKVHTSCGFLVANGERILLTEPDLRIYHESAGYSWNPWDRVLPKTKEGDFWQMNCPTQNDWFISTFLGSRLGVSIGAQPRCGVLAYDTVMDTSEWP